MWWMWMSFLLHIYFYKNEINNNFVFYKSPPIQNYPPHPAHPALINHGLILYIYIIYSILISSNKYIYIIIIKEFSKEKRGVGC